MTLPTGHPYKLVVIYWLDAVHHQDDIELAEVAERPPGCICVCAGWLVRDTPEVVTVVAEYEANAPVSLRDSWDIPRGLVVQMHELSTRPRKTKVKP